MTHNAEAVRLRQDFERLLTRTDDTQILIARLEERQQADFAWMQEIRDRLAQIDGNECADATQ